MSYQTLIRERFSARKFQDRPVEEEKLRRILEAGRLAPTAKDLQPYHVYVLKSEEARRKAKEVTKCTFDAPVILMICGVPVEGWVNPYNGHNGTDIDIAIITTHMMLAVTDEGLGSTWVGWFDTEKAKDIFSLPEGREPLAMLPLGYIADDCEPAPKHDIRKALADVVTEL